MPPKGGLQLPRNSLHIADGEVDVHGNRGSNVFQHHIACDWFGFEEGLINENGHVFLCAQPRQRLG